MHRNRDIQHGPRSGRPNMYMYGRKKYPLHSTGHGRERSFIIVSNSINVVKRNATMLSRK